MPICSNGGSANGNKCTCASGWTGPFCNVGEHISVQLYQSNVVSKIHVLPDMCVNKNNNVLNSANGRSLIFMVQTTLTMTYDISQIKGQINYLMSQINQQTIHRPGQSWFHRYILITFDDIGKRQYGKILLCDIGMSQSACDTSVRMSFYRSCDPGDYHQSVTLQVWNQLVSPKTRSHRNYYVHNGWNQIGSAECFAIQSNLYIL